MRSEDWQNVGHILAVRLDNIGDVIMLGPALRALKSALPQAAITLMASPGGSQVAPLLPWVDSVITWRAVWQDISGALPLDPVRETGLIEDLGSRHFDAAVIFTSFSQSPYPPAYVCYLAGIPIRLGHSKEFGGGILSECGKPPPDSGHQVDRNLALIELAGLPTGSRQLELFIPDAVQIKTDRLLQDNDVEPLAPFILLAPGASCAARRYDPALYACVARDLAALSGLPIVVVGSEREAGILSPLVELAAKGSKSNIHSLVGQTSVPELAALICRARLVIANNSASLHIADAFLRPMVILYSGTEYESQWAPRFAPAQLLRRETYCSPCYNFCCPYHMECLDIPPEEVVDAALHLLANQLKEGKQPAGVMFDERKDEKPS